MRRMWSKPQLLTSVEEEAKLNGIKVFEDIKDKDGHLRFIEGNIEIETIEGVTQKYGKWSLSGSHLLIVLAGDIANTTTITSGTKICDFVLPEWIYNKIAVLFGSNYIDMKIFNIFSSSGTTQTSTIELRKTDGKLRVTQGVNLTTTDARGFRYSFDLLIDNE